MTVAFAGADVGARRRHQLRGAVRAAAGQRWRSTRPRAPTAGRLSAWPHATAAPGRRRAPLPADVRLMNATAPRCSASSARSLLVAMARDRGSRASRCSRSARSASTATSRATASRRSAPTPRRSSPATSSRIDLARGAARLRVGAVGAPGGRAARLAEPAARCSSRSTAPVALWGSETATPRSSSTASARCSRPTSATSRTTTCRRSPGPTAARRTCWRCSAASTPVLAPLGARIETLAAVGPRLVARRARHRRRGRARPRQRRRRARAHGSASSRTLAQVTVALPAAARVRRPAPQRRLRGAAEGHLDRRCRPPSRRQEEDREDEHGQGTTRISSSASTSAPPR